VFEVTVEAAFSAAHSLKLYDGSYEPRHGHTWKVAVVAQAQALDSIGVVVDFEQLKPNLKKVLSEFQGVSFNDHPDFKDGKMNPSTELIAKTIHDRLLPGFKTGNAKITKVTVWETPDASASYCP
jgi:6-pyruvoyltetrahydropterin/6-carboxytetrahydropterin synthase